MSRIEDALKKAAAQRKDPSPTLTVAEKPGEPISGEVRSRASKKTSSALLDVVPITVDHPLLATVNDDKTALVEEFNKLRSAIIALTTGTEFLNTVMVTSTSSEEGKSLMALNLAISLAKEHDHTVLLVDTDLRRPSIHKYLGLTPEKGLVHCLRDNLPLEEVLIKTGLGKLVVLPAGEAINDPVNLLASQRMKQVVKELKERYSERYVIFDTPPAMPFADAGILAGIVDAILFVVREGKAELEDVKKTLKEFSSGNLLGVVYNDARSFVKKPSCYYY
ncbi:XrtA-associated tyrosine autokinase [Geopsychrobacter electrodiphilus]|uniref:XrtA-associated tyrosine autokinase n=1 Tax=Geopsychrobacter electrodiphilus TaxID=225196 RepID=UPI0003783E6C|nr:XrtA-associated tyrosine autokinase [Geopsychrobacter electrodiphilus]